MALASSVVELQAISKRYRPDGPPLFEALQFTLATGDFVAIMGESGTGKSTLLNIIAGLDRADAGRVFVDGVDLTAMDDDAITLLRRQRMGFVFQAFHVLPFLSVLQNVALPLQLLGETTARRRERALQALTAVGLAAHAQRLPRELSGGELQRVAVARALVHEPRLVLADEPTGNLDARTAAQVLAVLREQLRAHGASCLLITHSPVAARTADRVFTLDAQGLRPATAS